MPIVSVRRVGGLFTLFINGARSNRSFASKSRAETEAALLQTELNTPDPLPGK